MANNRMYFTCATCGVGVLIAKAFGEWESVYYDDIAERLNKFISEHNSCGPSAQMTNGTRFVLAYEHDGDRDAPKSASEPLPESGDATMLTYLHPPHDLLRDRYERLHADYLLTCERLRKLEAETAPMRRQDGGMPNGDLAGLRIELAQARAEADSYRARMRNGGVDPQEMGG